MKVLLNNNINFKGCAITPYQRSEHDYTFWTEILRPYEKTSSGRNILVNSSNWHLPLTAAGKEGTKLSLWGDDSNLFSDFFVQHRYEIPIIPQDIGQAEGTRVRISVTEYFTRAKKLAKALTEVLDIPKVLTQKALGEFIKDPKKLTTNILSLDILNQALAKIVKK